MVQPKRERWQDSTIMSYHRWAVVAALTASLIIQNGEAFTPGVYSQQQQRRSCLTARRRSTSQNRPPALRSYNNNKRQQQLPQQQLRYHPPSSQSPVLPSASIYFKNLADDDSVWSSPNSSSGGMWEKNKEKKVSLPATATNAVATSTNLQQNNIHDHITTTDKVVMAGATMATILAYFALLSAGGAGSWRFYLAGGICAAASHAVPVPVDVIKTRQQIDTNLENVPFMQAAKSIVANEGISALFLGMGPTVWGYFFEGSLKFGIYEVLKPLMQSLVATRWMAYVICGIVSGLVASVVLCPMEALRIRLVSEPDYAGVGGNWIQGGLKMLKNEGVFGLCKGMNPMIAKQVPYTVTKNVSFDLMTRFAYTIIGTTRRTAATSFFIPLTAAAIASVLSCIASQPGDMLLSVINAHEGKQTTRDVAKQLWRPTTEGGRRGQAFFVGMNTRFMHVGIIVTMQLLIYDMVKRLCGIAATGSV